MLAKITAKNQLTLPKSVTQTMGPVEYFDVQARGGQIILTPVRIQRGDAVRAKLAELDLSEKDLQNAAVAARGHQAPAKPASRTRQQNAAVTTALSNDALPPARRTLPKSGSKRGSAAVAAKPLARTAIKTRQTPPPAKKVAAAKRASAR
nr:AbrB/MazE/SpoVT family DNA-binding domain-containing protein [uncultured Roseateles sp.]